MMLSALVKPSVRHCLRRPLVAVGRSRFFVSENGEEFSESVASRSLEQEIEDANLRYAGKIEIRQAHGKGWGLFTVKSFEQNDLVIETKALETFQEPTSHTVQINWNKHVEIDLPARFLNHVCGEPNLYVRLNPTHSSYDFYALRRIDEDEELSFDYETSEYDTAARFDCSCGSSLCRGKLRGFRYHEEEIRSVFSEDHLAPYLLTSPLNEQG